MSTKRVIFEIKSVISSCDIPSFSDSSSFSLSTSLSLHIAIGNRLDIGQLHLHLESGSLEGPDKSLQVCVLNTVKICSLEPLELVEYSHTIYDNRDA